MKLFFITLCTLCTLILFFLLPQAVLSYQDSAFDNQLLRYETNPFLFQPTSQIADSLTLISNGFSMFTTSASFATRQEDEIYQAAMDTLHTLAKCDIKLSDSGIYKKNQIRPLLAVSNSSETVAQFKTEQEEITESNKKASAIFWSCLLEDPDGNQIHMLIDDATEQMVYFFFTNLTPKTETVSPSSAYVTRLSDFCEQYYGLVPGEILSNADGRQYDLNLLTPDGKTIVIRIEITYNYIAFNNFYY